MDSFLNSDKPDIVAFDIGVKHMACCIFYNPRCYTYKLFDISANNTTTRITKLFNNLSLIPIPNNVIIEKQVGANEIAMGIMYSLIMFYQGKTRTIELYDPKKKFKYQGFKNFKNKEHKQLSISYCRNILEKTNMNLLGVFETESKKDDIADAICMAVFSYIEFNNSNPKELILNLIK